MHLLAAAENIFFLILVAAIGLIRWIMVAAESGKNSKAQKRADPPKPNAPLERAPTQTEEERVRRFMEALGVPTTNTPPPKTTRRAVTPNIPRTKTIRPIDPFPQPRTASWPPVTTTSVPTPTPVFIPGMPVPPLINEVIASPKETTIRTASSAIFEVRDVAGGSPEEPPLLQPVTDAYRAITTARPLVRSESVNWQEIVRSPNGLRDAIILREIFGPPRGLQQNLAFGD